MSDIKNKIKQTEQLIYQSIHRDKVFFLRELNRLKKNIEHSSDEEKLIAKLLNVKNKAIASIEKKDQRIKNLPEIIYNPDLPIVARKNEIIETIEKNSVVIISGETGSGKTTQIPKFCIAAKRGICGKIACTQPRRIAAINVAKRIAHEMDEDIGKSVGYKIRFQDRTHENEYIKIMTDGILLAETQSDRFLNEYDTIIIDEAHERSLNIDFVLGILNNLVKKRKDLKLIITSATIDTEKFSKAFDNAPVIEVAGRSYPVDLRYEPIVEEEQTHVGKTVEIFDRLYMENPYGDILIFMPTELDIRETCELIRVRKYDNIDVMPLYARLSASEQARVFIGSGYRKVIVATNVAETSITIPGIKYVIDTGLARVPRYSPGSRTTSLPVVPISRSSADQRKGRSGRVENGICIRIFEEKDYESRLLFTPPEIIRANLAEVILQMIYLKMGDINRFPFIDRPSAKSITDGFELLLELGAIYSVKNKSKHKGQKKFSLTKKGELMARLPLDPRLSRMILNARDEGCLKNIIIIVSALTIQDPRERPTEKKEAADEAHKKYKDNDSDFITFLNIWKAYHTHKKKVKSLNQMKKYCMENFLSFRRMREWRDIHKQIFDTLIEYDIFKEEKKLNTKIKDRFEPLYVAIHKSILGGFLSNIAIKKDNNIFNAAKGRETIIFPGSGIFNTTGKWIVTAEMVETSRLFARINANINESWLEDIGKNLCKYTYSQAHWEKKRGDVVAYEQVSLFGMVIVANRTVSYGRVNPKDAADIFIRAALVEGDVDLNLLGKEFEFLKHNFELVDSIKNMEDKIRKRDILVTPDDMYLFYRSKLPDVYNIKTLKNFLKNKGTCDFLKMDSEALKLYSPEDEELSLFPEQIVLGNHLFECDYKFEPGKPEDGVTVKIPSKIVSCIPCQSIDWLVPGLYREKITALIKNLPKEYRIKLVPVSESVEIIVSEMEKVDSALITTLGHFIYKRFGISISSSAWDDSILPDHLKMRISITDPKGEVIKSGRDKSILKKDFTGANKTDDRLEQAKKRWGKKGIKKWDFGDLDDIIFLDERAEWGMFPGLAQEDDGLALRLFDNKNNAVTSHKKGVQELFSDYFSKDLKNLKKSLKLPVKIKNKANYFGGAELFEKRLYNHVVNDLFCLNIRTEKNFFEYAKKISKKIYSKGSDFLEKSITVLQTFHDARSVIYNFELKSHQNKVILEYFETLRNELDLLIPENFMELYDVNRMIHFGRYIKTIEIRAQRGFDDLEKQKANMEKVNCYKDKLKQVLADLTVDSSEEKKESIEDFFWSIEEYKVSVFAQELKTVIQVSEKILEKKFSTLQMMV